MEDIVLETIMFEHPCEWGRRIVKRGNEILLQGTITKGVIWKDMPLPEFKLIISETQLKSRSDNPYNGLIIQDVNMTKSRSEETRKLKFSPEIQSVIASGKLLNKRICSDEEKRYINANSNSCTGDVPPFQPSLLKFANENDHNSEVEAITFLGGFTVFGLQKNQMYLDENRFFKLA